MVVMRRSSCLLALAAVILTRAPAVRADEKHECVAAFEEAQQLRMDGKLRAARERLLVCSNERCPALLREDCTKWTSEVIAAMPTVVLGARDPQGRDVASARVRVDGALLAERLDGRPVTLDPGSHTFRFEVAGSPPVEQQALIRVGEKNREITVTIGASPSASLAGGPVALPASPVRGPVAPLEEAPVSGSHGVSPLVWIFGGAGTASLVASLALELSVKSDADHLRASCGSAGCSADQVDPLKTRQAIAGIALGAGLLSLGVATFLLVAHHPAQPADGATSVHVVVLGDGRGASASVLGRF
jgi:hypothetical protein